MNQFSLFNKFITVRALDYLKDNLESIPTQNLVMSLKTLNSNMVAKPVVNKPEYAKHWAYFESSISSKLRDPDISFSAHDLSNLMDIAHFFSSSLTQDLFRETLKMIERQKEYENYKARWVGLAIKCAHKLLVLEGLSAKDAE